MGRHLLQILCILTVAVCVRVWLIRHTEVISRDGIGYIEAAKRWEEDPHGVARTMRFPPGYPMAISVVHRLLGAIGIVEGIRTWELAGQIVSLVAGVLAILAIWILAGTTVNWRVGWVTCALFAVTRKWSIVGSDVLRDAMAICGVTWALVLTVAGVSLLRRRSPWVFAVGFGAGVCAALGYVARCEVALVLVLTIGLWVLFPQRQARNWPLTAGAVLVAVLGFVGCAWPFAGMMGSVVPHGRIGELFIAGYSSWGSGMLAQGGLSAPAVLLCFRELLNKSVEAIGPLMSLWVFVWFAYRGARSRITRKLPIGTSLTVSPIGSCIMLGWTGIIVPILCVCYHHKGLISYRYTLPWIVVVLPLAGSSVVVTSELLAAWVRRPGGRRRPGLLLWVLLTPMIAGLLIHTLRPLHYDKGYHRKAGDYIRQISDPQDRVVTDTKWIVHYSQIGGLAVPIDQLLRSNMLLRLLRAQGATYFAVRRRTIEDNGVEFRDSLSPPIFRDIAEFPQGSHGKVPDSVHVYQIDREALIDAVTGKSPSRLEPRVQGQ